MTSRSSGTSVAQPVRPLGVDLERAQVAVVEADEPRAASRGRASSSRCVVGLDERLQPELERAARRAAPAPRRGWRTASSRTRSAPAARSIGSWISLDDELLGQDRHATAARTAPQVVDRAAEPVRLAQHRDRRRAAGLVGAGARDDVLVGGRDPAGRRRRPLDLGDQVQTRRGERVRRSVAAAGSPRRPRVSGPGRQRPRPGCRPGAARRSPRRRWRARPAAAGRSATVMPAPRSVGPAAVRSPRRLPRRPPRLARASRAARSRARHRWSAPPARSPPRSARPRRPTRNAAAGVEQHDVATRARFAAQDRLDHPGVLVGRRHRTSRASSASLAARAPRRR